MGHKDTDIGGQKDGAPLQMWSRRCRIRKNFPEGKARVNGQGIGRKENERLPDGLTKELTSRLRKGDITIPAQRVMAIVMDQGFLDISHSPHFQMAVFIVVIFFFSSIFSLGVWWANNLLLDHRSPDH